LHAMQALSQLSYTPFHNNLYYTAFRTKPSIGLQAGLALDYQGRCACAATARCPSLEFKRY